MESQYPALLQKLDDFIRKYYINQMIRGVLLFISISLSVYLVLSFTEFVGHFSVPVRTVMFYSLIALYVSILVYYIVVPVLHILRIGKILSYTQASQIISNHFGELQDKLLNTLQLPQYNTDNGISNELVMASIEQRIKQIKPLPFPAAIPTQKNRKYFRILFVILAIFGLVWFLIPSIITEGSARILKYDEYYEPKAPFQFKLINDNLEVPKGGDVDIKIEVSGSYIPKNVAIEFGNSVFYMTPVVGNKKEFTYTFKNVNNTMNFNFEADEFRSRDYKLNVLPTPLIINFELNIDAPEYTNEPDKNLQNIGDITVPAGTKLNWKFTTRDIDSLSFKFLDSLFANASKTSENIWELNKTLMQTMPYTITIRNPYFTKKNTVRYTINVVPDMYPGITVHNVMDSINRTVFYFQGLINDDYGCSKLTFNYQTDANKTPVSVPIEINKTLPSQEYFYMFDFSSLKNTDISKVSYYFEVWDNDGIRGAKSSKSQVFEYKIPTQKEIATYAQNANESIENKVAKAKQLSDQIKQQINKLQQQNQDKNTTNWERQNSLKDIFEKQKSLEQLLKEISQENKQKNDLVNSFTEKENQNQEELREKQKQLEELLDKVMTDEMKQMLDEIQKMQDQLDESQIKEMTDKMKMSYEDLSKQLDKNLELLKRFDVEQRINKVAEQLHDLAKDQQQLSEQSQQKNANQQNLQEEQKEQKERFQDIMEQYKDAMKQNEQLSEQMQLQDFEQQKQDINQKFQQGEQQLQDKKNKKAGEEQKKNAESLEEMAEQMEQMMQDQEDKQNAENAEDLRQILENLLEFSFDQERLMKDLEKVQPDDPKYAQITIDQRNLGDDFTIIKDSLYALSKRAPEISSFINKELMEVTMGVPEIVSYLTELRRGNASTKQQMVMTSANNLALLLSESLKNMQEKNNSNKSGSCNKPDNRKNGKQKSPSLGQMRDLQQGLKQQLEQMMQQMKDGKLSKGQMSKQLAQQLAQQEMMQKMMQDLKQSGGMGKDAERMMEEINKLIEQNIDDLVNKRITNTTVNRQAEILTRLLEAENSERQREQDEKRESKEVKNEFYKKPEDVFKDSQLNEIFKENLNMTNLKLYNFYKNKYKEYLLKLNQ